MICGGIDSIQYRSEVSGYGVKLNAKRTNLASWMNDLAKAIGGWEDTSMFCKMQEGGDIRKCVFDNWRDELKADPEISFDAMLMKKVASELRYRPSLTTLQSILETPFFKKERSQILYCVLF